MLKKYFASGHSVWSRPPWLMFLN